MRDYNDITHASMDDAVITAQKQHIAFLQAEMALLEYMLSAERFTSRFLVVCFIAATVFFTVHFN